MARAPTRAGRGSPARGRGNRGRGRGRGRGGRRPRARPVLANDLNAPSQRLTYHGILRKFMNFKDNTTYPTERVFTDAELLAIQPSDLYRYFCLKTYGVENPRPEDNPTLARSNTIQYWKKAISYFMPNKTANWSVSPDGTGAGNPTRSPLINNLIRAVKRKETRGIGKKSKADRSFTKEEYAQVVTLLGTHGTELNQYRHVAMAKFQVHMIGRSDDTAHTKKMELERSSQFTDYLTIKLRWSKNVHEERDCPRQILLGAMNIDYCVLLGLAIWLERWVGREGASSQWLFADGWTDSTDDIEDQDAEAGNCRATYSRSLKAYVIDNAAFVRHGSVRGNLGTHSIRKFATTKCRQSGAHKDDANYRARWKAKRQQDTYADTQLDWPDVKAASKLCDGGVALYKVKDGVGLTNQWLAREVAPQITSTYGEGVGSILAKSLLWACFDPDACALVPADMVQDRLRKVRDLDLLLGEHENPIEKVEIVPSEVDGAVSLDPIPNDAEAGVETNGDAGAGTNLARYNVQWRTALYAKATSTAQRVMEMQQNQLAENAIIKRHLRRLEQMMRVIQTQPARIMGPVRPGLHVVAGDGGDPVRYGDSNQGQDMRPAVLGSCPRTLAVLWNEWQNGSAGSKPARLFTARERGVRSVKHKFCKRKPFWMCMVRLTSRGCTAATAMQRITSVYGDVAVTTILNKMKPDEKNGGHHLLRT